MCPLDYYQPTKCLIVYSGRWHVVVEVAIGHWTFSNCEKFFTQGKIENPKKLSVALAKEILLKRGIQTMFKKAIKNEITSFDGHSKAHLYSQLNWTLYAYGLCSLF